MEALNVHDIVSFPCKLVEFPPCHPRLDASRVAQCTEREHSVPVDLLLCSVEPDILLDQDGLNDLIASGFEAPRGSGP